MINLSEYLINLPVIFKDGMTIKGEHNFMVIIAASVCDCAGIKKEELHSNLKNRTFTDARKVFYYVVQKYSKITASSISSFLGFHDGMHIKDQIKTCEGLIQTNYKPITNLLSKVEADLFN